MTLQTITLNLPEPLYRTARQMAQVTRRPIETVLQDSLAAVLPPLNTIKPNKTTKLTKLTLLNAAALWREARAMMTPAEQAETRAQLDRQSAGALNSDKQPRLQELLQLYGRLMVHKAHAYLLLARRGCRVPSQPNRSSRCDGYAHCQAAARTDRCRSRPSVRLLPDTPRSHRHADGDRAHPVFASIWWIVSSSMRSCPASKRF